MGKSIFEPIVLKLLSYYVTSTVCSTSHLKNIYIIKIF